jgi:hypothetical protein
VDPLGLAQTTLALGLFPGGVVLALAGWLAARLAGRRGGWALDRRELFVLLLLDLAVAQAPVAGSPIASLPPGHGASANIAVVAAVVAAALVAASRETARGMRVAAAVVVVAAALALAVGAASLSLPAITGHPGGAMRPSPRARPRRPDARARRGVVSCGRRHGGRRGGRRGGLNAAFVAHCG